MSQQTKATALQALRMRLARMLAPTLPARQATTGQRAYSAARSTRTTGGFGGGNTSADAELASGLSILRARSRQMVRDSSYAKRARTVIINNVIGSGVGLQAQVTTTRGVMAERINADIETTYAAWCSADACHTGGAMHLYDMERAAMGQVFDAGECFIRKHYRPFGRSKVPLALELIEAERLADGLVDPGATSMLGEVRMGVEVDTFGRALAYWVRPRHAGDIRSVGGAPDRYERVPAADMYHLRLVDRWPQTRGEPWLHTVLRKLDDMNEYTALELTAARGSASYFATIETAEEGALQTETEDDGKAVMEIDPLTIQQLKPGEKLNFHSPNRPNSALDPFIRHMLREVAAGVGTSYESLSRDYSQSNYSSSRLALLDDRDLYKVLQQWWIRSFRQPLHQAWLQQAVLAGALPSIPVGQYAVDPAKFEAVLFKPRGWSWVDPTKEVNAYKEAIKAGITTLTDVIAQTQGGQDIEDIVRTRQRELQMLEDAGIEVDTTVPDPVELAAQSAAPTPSAKPADVPADGTAEDPPSDGEDPPVARVMQIKRGRS